MNWNTSPVVSKVDAAAAAAAAGWCNIQPTEYLRWYSEHGHDGEAVGR